MEFEKLQSIIAEVLGCDKSEITLETSFEDDLNVDSLDLLQIITSIEDEFDLKISDEDAFGIKTVEDAVNKIKEAK